MSLCRRHSANNVSASHLMSCGMLEGLSDHFVALDQPRDSLGPTLIRSSVLDETDRKTEDTRAHKTAQLVSYQAQLSILLLGKLHNILNQVILLLG